MQIRHAVRLLSLAIGVAAAAPAVGAQGVSTVTAHESALGPRRELATAGFRVIEERASPLTPVQTARRRSATSAQMLTILGGAAFIGGLLIGDDAGTVIAVGGLAAGILGLYLWLR